MIKRQPVVLKKGRDKSVRNRHHWIFSGAVAQYPEFEDGDLLPVVSHEGELLGYGYFNRRCSLCGRMVSFGRQDPWEAMEENLDRAVEMRRQLLAGTNAGRLINAEGDALPGLVVDQYGEVLLLQISTLGMVKLKERVIHWLVGKIKPRSIYEKSDSPARKEEGLAPFQGLIYGGAVEEVEIEENGLKFLVNIPRGQKTGFFLDQRSMRELLQNFASGRRVLDLFSYTGAFSVYALSGGAKEATLVESSAFALDLAQRNFEINGFSLDRVNLVRTDAFKFLHQENLSYDLIICDPPSFARRKSDLPGAYRGLKQLHRLLFRRVPAESLVMTFSCSYYVSGSAFQKLIFQAAQQEGRLVRLLQRHRLAFDHPLNIFHPESEYLKGFLLVVD